MSKAQEKATQRNVEMVRALMNKKLMGFKETYLSDYVRWSRQQLINRRDELIELDGTLINPEKPSRGKYDTAQQVAAIETKLSRTSIHALEVMTEANTNYNAKLDRLAMKLVEAGINYLGLRVERIGDSGRELSFLISDSNMEVHARLIFACGAIKAPHYRFITTKRNK